MNLHFKRASFPFFLLAMMLLAGFVPADDAAETVKWMSFEEAVEASKSDKKKIFIDVYTDWCGWCKVMDKNTFNNQTIAEYLNENFHSVKLDAEGTGDINFRDKTYKYIPSGKKGIHELAYALLNGKLSYPTVVFLDEDFKMITPVPGYQKPEQFYPIITFIGDDHYKNTSYEDYVKGFNNPF
jgi:thioredoxin-related protein